MSLASNFVNSGTPILDDLFKQAVVPSCAHQDIKSFDGKRARCATRSIVPGAIKKERYSARQFVIIAHRSKIATDLVINSIRNATGRKGRNRRSAGDGFQYDVG